MRVADRLAIIIQTVKVLFTKSATEGAGVGQKPLNSEKYDIGNNIYGDFSVLWRLLINF